MVIRNPSRRGVTAAIGALLTETACPAQSPVDTLTPEQFGAKGDGVTNDTAAFAELAAAVMRRGGGNVALRRVVYIVGEQHDARGSDGFYLAPKPIFSVTGLSAPLRFMGNGAILRCADGLRYGSFDPSTGQKLIARGANMDKRTIASPYGSMISIIASRAAIEIADLELDGNSAALRIGGSYGDTGIQVPATGIYLQDNRGDEILRRISLRRHGQDGLMINGVTDPAAGTRRLAQDVVCDGNGRQGCSLIGGRGWRFERCTFARSGRGSVSSAPAAGVDIEAEGAKTNRDHAFVDCSFVDNAGCGMVADTGDSADLSFTRCRFVGTTAAPIWPNKPGIRFDACRIVGSVVDCHGDADAARAVHFTGCLFTDDPRQFPARAIYRLGRVDGPLADLGNTQNVTFAACNFLAVGGATLPWSTAAIYRDCTMKQTSLSPGYPRGRFLGRNVLQGNVDIGGSPVAGRTTINGKVIGPR